jgi:uncharacterized protein YkwD
MARRGTLLTFLVIAVALLGARIPVHAECPTAEACIPAPPNPSDVPDAANDDPAGAATLVALVNRDRAAAGLAPVTPRSDVSDIAQAHSRAMAKARAIWHNDDYFTDTTRRALNAKALGENVSFNQSVADAHDQFMQSPGHRANILDPRFSVVGFAITRASDGTNFITEDFMTPGAPVAAVRAAAPAAKPAPRPRPATPRAAVAVAAKAPDATPVIAPISHVMRPALDERPQPRRPSGLARLVSTPVTAVPTLLVLAALAANATSWVFALRARRSLRLRRARP